MLERSQRDLRRSVRRKLAVRLLAVMIPLAVAAAVVVYYFERDRIGEEVLAWSAMQVALFNAEEGRLVDLLEGVEPELLTQAIADFASRHSGGSLGRFEAVQIFRPSGERVADFARPGALTEDQLVRLFDPGWYPRARNETWVEAIRVGGSPFLRLQLPLHSSRGELVGSMRGAFRPTEAVLAPARRRAWRAALAAAVLTCLVGVALWPLLRRVVDRLGRLSGSLLESNLEALDALGRALAVRDGDTEEHSLRVTIASVLLAEEVGLARRDIQNLIKGATLHDVGKIGIRDEILHKPGKLSAEEYERMKSHVEHGVDIVSRSAWLAPARDVVGFHHERYGGGGYSRGLVGDAIPLTARVFTIADVFDALASPRPYKEALDFAGVMEVMRQGRGTQFDPVLLDAFEGIAREVYDSYYGCSAEELEAALEELVDRYFSGGLDALQVG